MGTLTHLMSFDDFEGARLRENVAFWREKVDLLLAEKKDSLHEQMTSHKLIRDYEKQIEDLKAALKERDLKIQGLSLESRFLNQKKTFMEAGFVQTDRSSSPNEGLSG